MIRLRHALNFILCFALVMPFPAMAGAGQRTPESMLSLVDEYINEVKSDQPGPIFLLAGRDEYIAKAVVGQIDTLEAEDFNLFLFHLMERFVDSPTQRPYLFSLLKLIRESIAADLANTAQLREGPGHEIITGAYTYAAWILIGYAGVRFAAARSARGAEFIRELHKREIALNQAPRIYKIGYKVAGNPLVWSAAAGAGIGYWNYLLQSNRVHRLDPIEVLSVVQAQLACHLSYKALEIEDEFELIKNSDEKVKSDGKAFLEKVKNIGEQAGVLEKQFARLQSLDISERLFQKTLKQFPLSADWQQFRSALSEAEMSKDGQCRQMSLTHVQGELEKMAVVIGAKGVEQ